MSGRPNPGEVKQLRQALRDFAWERDRIQEHQTVIASNQQSLKEHEEELCKAQTRVEELMQKMDVASPGTAGSCSLA